MRVKLNTEQLSRLAQYVPFEVVLEESRDVKGFLEILGHNMPWNEIGDALKKPNRVTFAVEATNGGFVCDIHPAFACYLSTILPVEEKP